MIKIKYILNKKQYCANCEKETNLIALCSCCTKPTRILEVISITKTTLEVYKSDMADSFGEYTKLIDNKINETKEILSKIEYIWRTGVPKDLDEFNTLNDFKIVTERYLGVSQKNKARIESNKEEWTRIELRFIDSLLRKLIKN